MSYQDIALSKIFDVEGGYSNDPDDNGGETRYGITAAVARKFGYTGDMKDLPKETARQIYLQNYWHPLKLDVISDTMGTLAIELFDAAVNCGVGVTGIWFQSALNAVNWDEKRKTRLTPDIAIDGVIGQGTLRLFKAFEAKREAAWAERYLIAVVEAQQCVLYLNLTRKNHAQRKFMYGWVMKRIFD